MLDDLLSRVSARPLAIVPRQVRGIYNCLKMAAVNTSIYENIYDRLQLSTQIRFTVDYVVKS